MLWKDVPLFEIDGEIVDIGLGADQDVIDDYAIRKPARIKLHYPKGLDAWLLSADSGFGFGYKIQLYADPHLVVGEDHLIPLRVEARQDADVDGDFGVRVTSFSDRIANTEMIGDLNQWVTVMV